MSSWCSAYKQVEKRFALSERLLLIHLSDHITESKSFFLFPARSTHSEQRNVFHQERKSADWRGAKPNFERTIETDQCQESHPLISIRTLDARGLDLFFGVQRESSVRISKIRCHSSAFHRQQDNSHSHLETIRSITEGHVLDDERKTSHHSFLDNTLNGEKLDAMCHIDRRKLSNQTMKIRRRGKSSTCWGNSWTQEMLSGLLVRRMDLQVCRFVSVRYGRIIKKVLSACQRQVYCPLQ